MVTEFDRIQSRIQAVLGTVDETVLVVLKGHLLIEELLDEIIRKFVFHAVYLDSARLSFNQKLQIARSMSLSEHNNNVWDIAIKLNSLRNVLAHALDPAKRHSKTQALFDTYFENADESNHRDLLHGQEEHVILSFAIYYLMGFLHNFKSEVQRFREFVDCADKIMNPHRHNPK